MGYQTYYTLTVEPEDREEELLEELLDPNDKDWKLGDPLQESCKWYEHEREMVALSKRFPDVVFHLRGEGEESGDIWEKDFWNGLMQERPAEIVIPEYDPSWKGKRK